MGDRDAGVGGHSDRRRDAGHHLERDAGGRERFRLLAAAPEDERVAALEANDAFALARLGDEQVVDLLLAEAGAALLRRVLADEDALRFRRRQVEEACG